MAINPISNELPPPWEERGGALSLGVGAEESKGWGGGGSRENLPSREPRRHVRDLSAVPRSPRGPVCQSFRTATPAFLATLHPLTPQALTPPGPCAASSLLSLMACGSLTSPEPLPPGMGDSITEPAHTSPAPPPGHSEQRGTNGYAPQTIPDTALLRGEGF